MTKTVAVVTVSALVILGAFWSGVFVGVRATHVTVTAVLPQQVLELSRNANFNPETTDPNDAILWSAFLPQAKYCDDCNAFMEYSDGPMHHIRPVVVSLRDSENSSVGYTMVLGTVGYVPGQRLVQPTITYYVGSRSGALVRVSQNGEVMDRYSSTDWRPAKDPQVVRDHVRQFFRSRWRAQLAAAKY